jgi:hypothetical protein
MSKSRGFVFTINNPSEEDERLVQQLGCSEGVSFLVYGRERGESGTFHFQGAVEFRSPRSFRSVARLLPRGHVQQRRGSPQQAWDYCVKGGDFTSFGERPSGSGARTDIQSIRDILRSGGGLDEVVNAPQITPQLFKFAQASAAYFESPRDFKTTVYWYYGRSGTGKSRRARYELSGERVFTKCPGSGGWWDGYDAHKSVIIDDIRKEDFSFATLLSLLDRYEHRVPVKGGFRQFIANVVIITAPFSPVQFTPMGEEAEQLVRRIDLIEEFVDEWVPPVCEGEVLCDDSLGVVSVDVPVVCEPTQEFVHF